MALVRGTGVAEHVSQNRDEEMKLMAYGHAERTLAAIRLLEAETRELLSRQDQLDPEEAQWLRDVGQPELPGGIAA